MPRSIGGDESTDRRSHNGSDESRPRNVDHGSHQVVFLRSAQHHQPSHRNHHGASDALDDAGRRELPKPGAQSAEDRGRGKDGDGGDEYSTCSKAIRDPTADGNEDRQHQQIGGHPDVEIDGIHVEGSPHLGQRRGDDRAIQVLHEKRPGHQDGDCCRFPSGNRHCTNRFQLRVNLVSRVRLAAKYLSPASAAN